MRSERKSPDFPAAFEPDVLKRVEFIMKDSNEVHRYQRLGICAFSIFDAKTATYTPYGKDATFVRECHQVSYHREGEGLHIYGHPQR